MHSPSPGRGGARLRPSFLLPALLLALLPGLLPAGTLTPAAAAQEAMPTRGATDTVADATAGWYAFDLDIGQAMFNYGQLPQIVWDRALHQPVVHFTGTNTQSKLGVYAAANSYTFDPAGCGPEGMWDCGPAWLSPANGAAAAAAPAGQVAYLTVDTTAGNRPTIATRTGNTSLSKVAVANTGDASALGVAYATNGTPRVVYRDSYSSNRSVYLTYAYPGAGGAAWTQTTVDRYSVPSGTPGGISHGDFASFDISLNNGPAIAYRSQLTPTGPRRLAFAEYTGWGGYCRIIESDSILIPDDEVGPGWECNIVDAADGSGSFIDLHLPQCANCGDQTRIAYYNGLTGYVRLARRTGNILDQCTANVSMAGWRCANIDSAGSGAQGVAIATYNGASVIAYHDVNDQANGVVKLARYVGSGGNCGAGSEFGQWQCDLVDGGGAAGHSVGRFISATFDPAGRLYLAYFNSTTGRLRVAVEKARSRPVTTKTFSKTVLQPGQTATINITIGNLDMREPLANVRLIEGQAIYEYEPGSFTNNCGGTLSTANGVVNTLSLSGVRIGANNSCNVFGVIRAEDVPPLGYSVPTAPVQSNEARDGDPAQATLTIAAGGAKQDQEITFPPPADVPYGSPPFVLGATASSGLTVSYTSNTPAVCAVDGSTVAVGQVGGCSVTAKQAGSDAFNPAPDVSRSFQVLQGSQIIAFAAIPDKTLLDPPFTPSAQASSGLPVTLLSDTPGVCTVADNVVTLVGAGACTLVARQAGNANYAPAADVERSFAVAALPPGFTHRILLPLVDR